MVGSGRLPRRQAEVQGRPSAPTKSTKTAKKSRVGSAAAPMQPDLAGALELADLADAITLPRFRAADPQVETKPDLTPVTEADRAVEEALRERIARERPGESIVGEEEGAATAGRAGSIDPIDATKNYVRGIPVFATLIALEGRAAVVSAPRRSGSAGGRRAARARSPTGDRSRVSGSPDRGRRTDLHVTASARPLPPARRALLGAARLRRLLAVHAARRGRGRPLRRGEANHWDLAAPKLIVEEAGGRVTDLRGVDTADGRRLPRHERPPARRGAAGATRRVDGARSGGARRGGRATPRAEDRAAGRRSARHRGRFGPPRGGSGGRS